MKKELIDTICQITESYERGFITVNEFALQIAETRVMIAEETGLIEKIEKAKEDLKNVKWFLKGLDPFINNSFGYSQAVREL